MVKRNEPASKNKAFCIIAVHPRVYFVFNVILTIKPLKQKLNYIHINADLNYVVRTHIVVMKKKMIKKINKILPNSM